MLLSLVPKRTSNKGALGPFSSRSLEKEPNPKGWYRGVKREASPPLSRLGIHFLSVCSLSLLPPHL